MPPTIVAGPPRLRAALAVDAMSPLEKARAQFNPGNSAPPRGERMSRSNSRIEMPFSCLTRKERTEKVVWSYY